MLKGVIFDFDGVLVDSENINITATKRALLYFGVRLKRSDYGLIIGRHPKEYNKDLYKKFAIDPEKLFVQQEIEFDKLFPNSVKLNKYIIDIIHLLKNKKIIVSLNTSSAKSEVNIILIKFGLDNLFDYIIHSGLYTNLKPAPDSYFKTLNTMKLSANECIAVEDSLPGVLSAQSANIKCILLKTKFNKAVQCDLKCNARQLKNLIMRFI